MTETSLHLSRLHFPVTSLGPGARIGIWFQGCSIRCPGCISLDTWDTRAGLTTVAAVLRTIGPWLGQADGITISGGEPFDQPDALRELLSAARSRYSGDFLVYSGYPLEQLPLSQFHGLIDVVVSDPFEVAAAQTLTLRGSDNQRLTPLTPLGHALFGSMAMQRHNGRSHLDVMVEEESGDIFIAGIPLRGDLARLKRALAQNGHRASTTEDTRRHP
jgi:anaerobic ribonucleoside-triphosphate reductase activating protein